MTIDPDELGVTADEIRVALESDNIEARPLWKPMHRQPLYAEFRHVGGDVSENLFRHGLCLPSGSAMTDSDLARVVRRFLDAVE